MKTDKIDYLIDELGKIDDRFVDEAMIFQARRSSRRRLSKSLSLVAAVVLVFTVSLALIANMGDKKSDANNAPDDTQASSDILYDELISLDAQALASVKVEGEVTQLLYSDTPRLIWTFDGEVYYSVTLRNKADLEMINNYLKNDRPKKAAPDDEFSNFRFWISYGDGRATTPYLEKNSGRISYNSLSDYLPEIYPSGAFARFISDLISEQI